MLNKIKEIMDMSYINTITFLNIKNLPKPEKDKCSLTKTDLDKLKDKFGIYIFYNKFNNEVYYVGGVEKRDLTKRIPQHFSLSEDNNNFYKKFSSDEEYEDLIAKYSSLFVIFYDELEDAIKYKPKIQEILNPKY